MLYVDSDAFLGLVKRDDHLKARATAFFEMHASSELVTSTMTLMEVWFHYYKNRLPFVHESILSIRKMVGEVWDVSDPVVESALLLGLKFRLSPSDAVHATLALATDGIVSTDRSFERVDGLRCVRF